MDVHTEKLIEELRRASVRTPEQKARDAEAQARIEVLTSSGEISADELGRGVLRVVLKVYGHSTDVPGLGRNCQYLWIGVFQATSVPAS